MNRLRELSQMPGLFLESEPPKEGSPRSLKLDPKGIFFGVLEPTSDCRVGQLLYNKSLVTSEYLGDDERIRGIVAGLCLLFTDTSYTRWRQFEYREFESFLRTENHTPTFVESPFLEEMAQKMLNDLKKYLLLAHFKLVLEGLKLSFRWEGSLILKAQLALKLQNLVFRPFCQKFGLTWELFSLEGENFIFKGGPKSDWELSTLGEFIRYTFQRETLNIVAEA